MGEGEHLPQMICHCKTMSRKGKVVPFSLRPCEFWACPHALTCTRIFLICSWQVTEHWQPLHRRSWRSREQPRKQGDRSPPGHWYFCRRPRGQEQEGHRHHRPWDALGRYAQPWRVAPLGFMVKFAHVIFETIKDSFVRNLYTTELSPNYSIAKVRGTGLEKEQGPLIFN